MTSNRAVVLTLVLGACATGSAAAQNAAPDSGFSTVDRIVAVVGDIPISATRVDEEVNVRRQQGTEVPTDPDELARFRREVLDAIIEQEVLIQAALRDTAVSVSEQDLQQAVEDGLREIRTQFTTELDYSRELRNVGFDSPEDYRLWYTEQKRRELLQERLISVLHDRGDIRPVSPTEAELREYFEETKPRHPKRPPTVSFRQIVVAVEADSAAWDAARVLADSVYQLVSDAPDDFPLLARRFSDDPGSKEQGGDLGYFRRGLMVPEFDAVAFRMRPGQISPPVRTPFGYHIIKVERVEPAEIQASHILIAPEFTDDDIARTRKIAEAVAQQLLDGAPFDSLSRVFHDRLEQSLVEDQPRDQLPQAYRDALAGAEPDDVVGPVQIESPPGRPPKFAVLVIEEVREAGEYSFEDLRERLRGNLSQEKAFRRYIDRLKERTYIDVRL
jgi:peptidyl-prolyl cis-trans isomerase SurA